jgi:hypothetical protein
MGPDVKQHIRPATHNHKMAKYHPTANDSPCHSPVLAFAAPLWHR